MKTALTTAALLIVALGSCDSSVETKPTSEPGPVEAHGEIWFDPTELLEVRVDMDPTDADEMAHQERSILDVLGGEQCLDQPFTSPYTWFEADVQIGDELLASSGIRKKGFIGSLDVNRPSLKFKFNKFVSEQLLSDGTERFTVNNGKQDPSRIRPCLTYDLFRAAGLAAPRCNFAHVVVLENDLGVYAHVEALKKNFLLYAFGHDDGSLYEGTLSDFAVGWMGTFESKTDGTDETLAPLVALKDALELPDAELVAAVEEVLDLDTYITFWAMEVLTGHWDGYASNTNNFFVFFDNTSGKLQFIPWGADASFSPTNNSIAENTHLALMANGKLAQKLYQQPVVRDQYLAKLQDLLDTVWDEEKLLAEIDRMQALIEGSVLDADRASDETQEIRDFVMGRRSELLDALAAAEPEAPTWDNRDRPCFVEQGSVETTLETTWNSLLTGATTGGANAMQLIYQDETVPLQAPFLAVAGSDPAKPDEALLISIASTGPDDQLFVVVIMPPDLVAPGTFDLSHGNIEGYLLTQNTPTQSEPQLVGFLEGQLVISEGSTGGGDAISATVSASILTVF